MLSKYIYRLVMSAAVLLGTATISSCSGGDNDDPQTVVPKPGEGDKNNDEEVGPPEGKEVYIPEELRSMNLKNDASKWCWKRTKATKDVILFWAKGFGDDLSNAPSLQGEDMRVDADLLLRKVQEFYDYYYDNLKFVNPGSTNADKYRMMVMLDYSLEGTAYGGTYDNTIGALWVAPNRVRDKNMNAVAHELGHSFQLQVIADGAGDAWGGCGFYEMTSQWMLWQVNPDWQTEEYYHLEEFRKLTHKAFLHIDNIYHSPYVIEMWALRHGDPFIAELYRKGRVNEDPVMTYKRETAIDQAEFNDEMWHNYARLINWDIERVRDNAKPYRNQWQTKMTDAGDGWKRVARENAPENYGFNAIPLPLPGEGESVKVEFRGEAGFDGFFTKNIDRAGWRYGWVAVDSEGNSIYGSPCSDPDGEVEFSCPDGLKLTHLWLVVMGAPTEHWRNIDGATEPTDAQWPYSIRIVQ